MLKRYGFVLVFSFVVFFVPSKSIAEGNLWGTDVLIYQASVVKDFSLSQADKDTLYMSLSVQGTGLDTLVTGYSVDNGQNWNFTSRSYFSGMGQKAETIAARGDSNYVFSFTLRYGRVFYLRRTMNLGLAFPNWNGYVTDVISAPGDTVVDFSVCRTFDDNYYLFVVYQTQDGRIMFTRSTDYGLNWGEVVNLSVSVNMNNNPVIAYAAGNNLAVAAEYTVDSTIHVVRNIAKGDSTSWDWANSVALDEAGTNHVNPSIAASHDTSGAEPVFWIFADWYRISTPPDYALHYYYSTDGGATWSNQGVFEDTSGYYNRLYPSIHVLPELGSSDITLVYRYEGAPTELRQMLKANQQSSPGNWTPVPSTGVNDYEPGILVPHQGYTIRMTNNDISSLVIYEYNNGLYMDSASFTDVRDEAWAWPIKGFTLMQNYPNPFNPSTAIGYSLDKGREVEITVYNILGQKVKTLYEGYKPSGYHRISWDGTDKDGISVASGVYLYQIKSKEQKEIKKMVLMR